MIISSIHHGKICAPRAYRLAILLRHHARRLRNVPEVVRDPRRQQLAKRDRSELRMLAFERELRLGESPTLRASQISARSRANSRATR